MKCEICDQDFANSAELELHKEREHPKDEQEDEQLEEPDRMDPDSEPAKPGMLH